MAGFYIATEDSLSQTVAARLITETGHIVVDFIPKDRRRHAGFGYLKAKLSSFIASCQGGLNFLVLTDLDTRPCPLCLLHDWLGTTAKPDSLLLRIAVREVESWVLADRSGFAEWLGVSEAAVPMSPDACLDPKADLLKLAANSTNRKLREGLRPKKGAISKIGLEYNDLLSSFVRDQWQIEMASLISPSLERTICRLRKF